MDKNSSLNKTDFKEFNDKLLPLPSKVRNKALKLAAGIISVYGLTREAALNEAIKRSIEFYNNEEFESETRVLSNKLIG